MSQTLQPSHPSPFHLLTPTLPAPQHITAGSSLFPGKRNRVVLRSDRVVLVPVCLESPVCGRYPLKILLFYLRRLPSYFPEVVHLSIQTVVIKSQKFKVKTPGHKPSLAAYGTVWSCTYEILRRPRLHVCMNNTIILSWGLLGNSKWTTVKDSSKQWEVERTRLQLTHEDWYRLQTCQRDPTEPMVWIYSKSRSKVRRREG